MICTIAKNRRYLIRLSPLPPESENASCALSKHNLPTCCSAPPKFTITRRNIIIIQSDVCTNTSGANTNTTRQSIAQSSERRTECWVSVCTKEALGTAKSTCQFTAIRSIASHWWTMCVLCIGSRNEGCAQGFRVAAGFIELGMSHRIAKSNSAACLLWFPMTKPKCRCCKSEKHSERVLL